MKKLLIANRGEIALRVLRAARDLEIGTVSVYSQDDQGALHRILADEAVALDGAGPAAYLDMAGIIAAAQASGCDAIHPGYGFLSERADFAQACHDAGIRFIGPTVEQLALFGDKGRALELAADCDVPVMPATRGAASLEEIASFFDQQAGAGVVIKAVGGGGGRGMRVVRRREDLAEAYARCRSEASSAFGIDAVYAERLVARARHIEVQIAGDGTHVIALGERDCTLQRRFQKLVEIAPSPVLKPQLREQIIKAALRLARRVNYQSLGTFEFLVEETESGEQKDFVFIEANPRLQVEHTITEQVTGVDLVALQIGIAGGQTLCGLGLDPAAPPQARGYAIQVRINAEMTDAHGLARPAHGRLERFDPPSGPDVRVDSHGYTGYEPSPNFDTLLAKLIVSSAAPKFDAAVRRLQRSLAEFRIAGVPTNLNLLRALVQRDDFLAQDVHTRHFEAIVPELTAAADAIAQAGRAHEALLGGASPPSQALAPRHADPEEEIVEGLVAVRAPLTGRVVEIAVALDEIVKPGQTVAVLDAMKMEHAIVAECGGRVVDLRLEPGALASENQVLIVLEQLEADGIAVAAALQADPNAIRADLQRVLDRHAYLDDAARPDAVARRRSRGQRTARENVADLCDPDTFVEYGALALAAQASRRSQQDLIVNTPADGLITGIGNINGELVGKERARSAVMAYDATVMAGTQGKRNHIKTDRIVEVALRDELPLVLFGEGGGGRPGDVDFPSVSGLYQPSFAAFAELSGNVPVVGIVSGRCFAGNAAFVGCCDIIIADKSANIGMAGPAMIEGGGLGIFRPEEVGPASVQVANGVVDILVDNEAQAVQAAKHYLSMFQGRVAHWSAPEALALRHVVPENRLRVYDTRKAIEGIADVGSVLMLRSGFGAGIHTALARVEGQPVGIIANNPYHLGGAIDADAADKASRFMQLCDAHGVPIISLIDTPGFMVGPECEARAQVRHVSRMFLTAAKLRVALLAVTLRKGYGLGAMAMAGGGFRSASFTVSWPTGEFGPMGLEGAVRLGFKKELEAVPDGPERKALFDRLVAQSYERGHAINTAAAVEIDAVIDPAQTRKWIAQGIASAELRGRRARRGFIDAW
ncbi:putative acetylCoA carboxylase, Biotin carboxylase, Pyruvate carboxylase., Propionyl-CoA carboxylase, carboxyl transferase [Cupriavidus taiwanensis]|uniref:acetyl-CoA carboxylase n=1 Tax=Cupriavidus taiwanensis TaxID=164546 RepID=A0A375E8K1_9BURK|nr:carboxyl transferase domain-containing protein [Cupriavidus taiwanensis]SOZ66372.1 putative acetylCoA carboxylase, Biotin carboxylase, Pyruvate carboxylase., Propionyl-CoA carboxylase, carboxyl transferase [Cupriavidus taiwanensis]SOZ67189.1 putative acetylCoA carboxylase, Biotin carboxylase, Pyruvate carboxylase., Propionyl-CoA carboxylase, carboxyl transferase [Cupriavidus taiwanensis]SOZ70720.1 putative acetylCoA carboxylase, Biotin carboxylase, Pyruvate carboxylase., Propionyl-CoA carboxy